MTLTSDTLAHEDGFRLSRIQAEGWAAAHKCANGGMHCDGAKVSSLNPYKIEVERVRWFAGFKSALDRL
ncbi:MAG: hypothetical protein ACTHLR_03205 [Rhizomicrobium sp.]